jgi:hypothetical protein
MMYGPGAARHTMHCALAGTIHGQLPFNTQGNEGGSHHAQFAKMTEAKFAHGHGHAKPF